MRNLKRALSLALASVMLMGMMVVGTSAASFPDVDDNDNIEAIDVLETVEVMIGNENGDFEPDKNVTRAEMAVVMAKLLNLDYNYYVTSCPFDDVPEWARGYVGACAANGIVSGRGEGVYDPNATVTAVEAASMMMRALGYFKNSGDYSPNFESATVRQASEISLFSGIGGNATAPLNRNQVAQLALNALEARMVYFTGDMGFEMPGVGNVGYRTEYTFRTGSETKYNAIVEDGGKSSVGIEGQYYVQLGEQLYDGDLKKLASTDVFDRPATKWTYKTKEIGVYADTPDFVFTTAASGDTAADKVKNMDLKGLTWDGVYYENGRSASVSGADSAARLEVLADKIAADGVLIEVFMDNSRANTIGTVTVIRTQMMQIASVNAKQVTLKALGDNKRDGESTAIPMGLNKSDFYSVRAVKEDDKGFDVMKDLKVDDYVLVVPVEDGASYKVGKAIVPETATGRLTNIQTKSTDNKVKSITVDGETYGMSYSWTSAGNDLRYNTKLTNKKDATVYFDEYGYAIYVKDVTASNGAIIVKNVYNSIVDGKIVTFVQGWDTNGEELSLNLGTSANLMGKTQDSIRGTVWEYTSSNVNDAEYALVARGADNSVSNGKGNRLVYTPAETGTNSEVTEQWIKNGQFYADVTASNKNDGTTNSYAGGAVAGRTIQMATDVKFIFLSTDGGKGTNTTGLTIREGVTAVGEDKGILNKYDSSDRLESISYILNGDKDKVVAVVVDTDGDAAVTENLIFVETANEHWMDTDDSNKIKTKFKAYDANGELLDDGSSKLNKELHTTALAEKFFTFSQNSDDVYSLTEYTRTDRITSVATGVDINAVSDNGYFTGAGSLYLNARDAKVIDLDTGDGVIVNSASDMARAIKDGDATGFKIAYIYNGAENNQGFKTVSTVFVLKTLTSANTEYQITGGGTSYKFGLTADGPFSAALTGLKVGDEVFVRKVSADATKMTLKYDSEAVGTLVPSYSDVYKFTMTAGDKAESNFSVAGVELPDGFAAVNIDGSNVVTIEYTTANRPSNIKVASAIKTYLESQGYTNVKTGWDETTATTMKITADETEDGITLPKTFTFDTKPASTAYLVSYKVDDIQKNAITDTTEVGDAAVANTATSGSSYVKVKGATTDDDTYVLDNTTVKAGANYEAGKKYHMVTITAKKVESNGVTYTLGGVAKQFVLESDSTAAGTATFTVAVGGTDGATAGTATVTTTGVTADGSDTVANVTSTPASGSITLTSAGTSKGDLEGTFTYTVKNLAGDLAITIA